jgi:hypothetical protein
LIITSTLKFPKNHKFIGKKPDIEEKITKIIPVYAKIGPTLKTEGKKLIKWINQNQAEIIKILEKKEDIKLSEVPDIKTDQKIFLIKDGFIKIEKQVKIKGRKNSKILRFKGFYLEIKK